MKRIITIFVLLMITNIMPIHAGIDYSACMEVEPNTTIDQACLNLMEAFPEPTVIPIQHDSTTLDIYSFWRVVNENANVFDAPGGSVTRNLGAGFNFVRVIGEADGWVQIETGEWMQDFDVEYSEASLFRGVRILNGLEGTRFAWALGDLFTSAYPGGPQDSENGKLLLRYDLINIFNEVEDEDGWRWYMVGPDQWIEQRMVAKVFKIERPEGVEGRWVSVDLYEQTAVAYEDDTPVFATLISSGYPPNETNLGIFNIWARLDVDGMSGAAGAPDGWNLQSVPWVMYFDDSISLHGTYWHDTFGYRHSRGCVNLSISDASYLFEWLGETDMVDEEGNPLNYVYVHSSGEYRSLGT